MGQKAMIFAAGLGTRLRPLTDHKPKALVEINGVTMLERVLRRVIDAGCDDIVVNVCHFGEQIIDFLAAKNNFGVKIHISDEREALLDTGGGVLAARQWLEGDGDILIHNADILTDFNLNSMMEFHAQSGADATLLVKPRNTARYLLFEQDKMCGWTNVQTGEVKPQGLVYDAEKMQALAFGGVHVISGRIFSTLEKYATDPKFSITPFYIDSCRELKIMGYQPVESYQWHDIGKIESLRAAEEAMRE